MSYLKGYKTYIIAFLMVLVALVQMANGEMGLQAFLNDPNLLLLLQGLGLGALRHGIG